MRQISAFIAAGVVCLFAFGVFTKVFAASCTGQIPCTIGDRSYHVLPPDNWDGISKLPILIHYHGWGRQGHVPVQHKHIGGATRTRGVLLVAPDGLGKSWDFWRPGSRDTDFTLKVLEHIERTYPIDRNRLYISGYSWGSSMAWRFACEAGNKVNILFGISGTLYNQNEDCATGPVEVRHVHGLKDTVMDFPYGANGDETGPVELWTRINECGVNHTRSQWQTSQSFSRYEWKECETGKPVTLDVHAGGHWIARGWLAQQLDEILPRQ